MANILTQEDEQNQQNQGTVAPTNPMGNQGGAASNAPTQNANPKPQGSGRFTNLQKYLGANKQAGDQLSGGIRKKGDEYIGSVREGISSAKGVQEGIAGERSRIGQAGQLAQGIETDAVNVAQNSLDDVTKLRLGQNQANQLQGQGQQTLQNLQQGINPLQDFGQNLGSESGRFQVLQDTFGGAYKPNYNMGQRRLDQLFLQASPDTQLNQLQNEIGDTVTGANQSLSSLQRDLGTGIQDIRGGASDAQRQILNSIGSFDPDAKGAFGTLYGDLTTEQGNRRSELDDYLQKARSQFGTGTMDRSVADLLNLSGSTNYGVMDLKDYANKNINLGDTDVTMADVIDRNDYQNRLNALSQLSGTQISDYDIGEKEGSDINFDSGKWTADTNKHMQNFDKNFGQQSLFDAVGNKRETGNTFAGTDSELAKIRKQLSLQDMIDVRGSGDTFYTNPDGVLSHGTMGGYDPNADLSTIDKLKGIDAANRGAYGYMPAVSEQWQGIMDYFNKSQKNKTRILDDVSDLEGSGNFNVK